MTAVATSPTLRETAHDCFDRNCQALGIALPFPDVEFAIARDGALTAKPDGTWLGGCSVPRRAAELMVKPVQANGQVTCLLLPSNAQQIVALLDHLTPSQAVIALLPSMSDLPIYLACCDFTKAIDAHRLFFADESSLRDLFNKHPGLAPAQQLVRLPDAPADRVEALIRSVQTTFADLTVAQTVRANQARSQWTVARQSLFVHASEHFKLWDDAGFMLADNSDTDAVDTSDATRAATGWLAERASQHAAMLTSDLGRADRPELAHADQPWLTWITRPRVPLFVAASPRDGLLLAHESLIDIARAAGWPSDRLIVAAWPSDTLRCRAGQPLTIIADLLDLEPPADIKDYSSWRVVWDAIRDELTRQPLALGNDPIRYLNHALVRLQLPSENFPRTVFLNRLLPGAFMVGLATLLMKDGIPIAVHGSGWDSHEELHPVIRGPVTTRDAWREAIADASGVIDPFITQAAHPIRSLTVPRLSPLGMTRLRFLNEARAIVSGRVAVSEVAPRVLTRKLIDSLLDG